MSYEDSLRWRAPRLGDPRLGVTISPEEAETLADLVGAARELKDDYEETDPYPTSDGHPLYKTRAAFARLDSLSAEEGDSHE